MANAMALVAVGLFVLKAPSAESSFLTSPLDPQHLETCRQAVSQALFDGGQSGLVQTAKGGTILIQLQRPLLTSSMRLDADAAVWSALEAITSRNDCHNLGAVQVTVVLAPTDQASSCLNGSCQQIRAVARVSMSDLMLWSLGEIDDAELSSRLAYFPPAVALPDDPHATAFP